MRAYDIIKKKRDGERLSVDEIDFFINGYTDGFVSDEQVAAFLMSVYFNGMDIDETFYLTNAIINSGSIADLSDIEGIKVDKHSTGGVGDKTTLVVIPIVASLGVKVAKLRGRGLGHTWGTVDKLESIKGFKTSVSSKELIDIVNKTGAGVAGQSADLAPADKKLYALRDVTATVDEPSLIASIIMSKKLASGADKILLDVKVGSGAFNKNIEHGSKLARIMTDIGKLAGKQTVAILTNMDKPLGNTIGNSIELIEAIETLKGNGPDDFKNICITLSAYMLFLAEKGTIEECYQMSREAISNGSALNKFKEIITAQGGDSSYCDDYSMLPISKYKYEFKAQTSGYIESVDCEKYGIAASLLGAGRNKKEDDIDHGAGIRLLKKTGDYVSYGDIIAVLYSSRPNVDNAINTLKKATQIGNSKPEATKMVFDIIGL